MFIFVLFTKNFWTQSQKKSNEKPLVSIVKVSITKCFLLKKEKKRVPFILKFIIINYVHYEPKPKDDPKKLNPDLIWVAVTNTLCL